MPLTRIVHLTYPPDTAGRAIRIWKEELGPLIAGQPGCLSEQFFRCHDTENEFVSISQWETEDSIRSYQKSPAYHQIRGEHRDLKGGDVSVGLYTLI